MAHAKVLRLLPASNETWLTNGAGDATDASLLVAARTRASTAHVTALRVLHTSGEA